MPETQSWVERAGQRAGRFSIPDASAAIGGGLWVALVGSSGLTSVPLAIALAVLVLVPLGLGIWAPAEGSRAAAYRRRAVQTQPIAAVPAAASLLVGPGALAAVLVLPWAVVAALVALGGVSSLRARCEADVRNALAAVDGTVPTMADVGAIGDAFRPVTALTRDAGLVYVAVGAFGLLLDRAGVSLVFDPAFVTLAAVHFHFAGFALPLIAGVGGRLAPENRIGAFYRGATAVIAVGPGLIGLGITAVALAIPGAAAFEFVVAVGFTVAVVTFAATCLLGVVPRLDGRVQQGLLAVACLAITVSMAVAVLYATARLTGGTYVGIHETAYGRMVRSHGVLNALGFALPGLVAWRLASSGTRS